MQRGPRSSRSRQATGIDVGDKIMPRPQSVAQVRFVDETRLVAGSDSRIGIENFTADPAGAVQAVRISAEKGPFRFVTGDGPHEAYTIETPTMRIHVKGTVVDGFVRANGETLAAVLAGSAEACDLAGACVELVADCTVAVTPPGGGISVLEPGLQRSLRISAYFPFVVSQRWLEPSVWADVNSCFGGGLLRPQEESGNSKRSGERPLRSPPPRPDPDPSQDPDPDPDPDPDRPDPDPGPGG